MKDYGKDCGKCYGLYYSGGALRGAAGSASSAGPACTVLGRLFTSSQDLFA